MMPDASLFSPAGVLTMTATFFSFSLSNSAGESVPLMTFTMFAMNVTQPELHAVDVAAKKQTASIRTQLVESFPVFCKRAFAR
jgi:hypothetical protein